MKTKTFCVANLPAYLYDDKRHFIQAGSRWSFSMDKPKGQHSHPHYQPYPFNLGYAVSFLKQRLDTEVVMFDGCALNMDEKEFKYAVYGAEANVLIVEVPTVSFPYAMQLLREIQVMMPELRIMVAGAHVTALPNSIPSMFTSLIGEWERRLSKDCSVEYVDYPFPERIAFRNEFYSNFEFHRPSSQIVSSRGCSVGCEFCVEYQVLYKTPIVRCRSAFNVVQEMSVCSGLGAKQIWFDDMSITAKKGHVEALCKEIYAGKLDFPWTAMADMNATVKTVKLMSENGCLGLAFGVESINPETLRSIHKLSVSKTKAQNFVQLLHKYNLFAVATFMIGLPDETEQSIKRTILFATEELGADAIQFSIATPFPGTKFYDRCLRNGWMATNDWSRFDGAKFSVTDYPQLKHLTIQKLFKYAMTKRKETGVAFRKEG